VLVEEIAHILDDRLYVERSPFSSAGAHWSDSEYDRSGRIRPFNIPNRKQCSDPCDQSAEDWASVLVWFLYKPGHLRLICRPRFLFMERLFHTLSANDRRRKS